MFPQPYFICFLWGFAVRQRPAASNALLTHSSVIEHRWQDEQDVVGPVLPVVGHLELLDHQDVQVRGALHGMEKVQQAVLLASRCRGEDRTF